MKSTWTRDCWEHLASKKEEKKKSFHVNSFKCRFNWSLFVSIICNQHNIKLSNTIEKTFIQEKTTDEEMYAIRLPSVTVELNSIESVNSRLSQVLLNYCDFYLNGGYYP